MATERMATERMATERMATERMATERMATERMATERMTDEQTTIVPADVHRLTAFSTIVTGGNPAGVWIGESLPTNQEMLAVAAEIGYSETVFAVVNKTDTPTTAGHHKPTRDDQLALENEIPPENEVPDEPMTTDEQAEAGNRPIETRYFSPLAEVPFCGHATIALGVHLGRTYGAGRYVLATRAGEIPLFVETVDGNWTATLTSVEPSSVLAATDQATAGLVDEVLASLNWDENALDRNRPPAIAYAGARHLILTLKDRSTLAEASYDFEPMKALMSQHDLTTVDLVWHEEKNGETGTSTTTDSLTTTSIVHSRNLFAIGGVVEDPATGAAAAAFVGHLRSSGQIHAPHVVTIHQGHDMGRPSLLHVFAPVVGGIEVSGTAVPLHSE